MLRRTLFFLELSNIHHRRIDMAPSIKVLLAIVLCFDFVHSDTSIFTKEPSDAEFTLGRSATIECLLSVEATECIWLKENLSITIDGKNYILSKRTQKENCQLQIAKTSVDDARDWACLVKTTANGTHISKTAQLKAKSPAKAPAIRLNNKYTVSAASAILSPEDATYDIEVTVADAYPLLLKNGSFYSYQDGVPLIQDIVLKDSTAVVGANILVANLTVHVLKTTLLTFVTKHPAIYNQERKTEIMFKTDDLKMNFVAIARPTTAAVSFEIEREQGLTIRDASYRWYEQTPGSTDWTLMTQETKTKLDRNSLKPGNYSYRVVATQDKFFDQTIKAESPVLHLLTYEPLSDASIIYPPPNATSISTKRGNLVTLQCFATGYPEPEYRWVKVVNDQLETVRKSQNLTLGKDIAESGRYKCGAVQALLGQRLVRDAKQVVTLTVT